MFNAFPFGPRAPLQRQSENAVLFEPNRFSVPHADPFKYYKSLMGDIPKVVVPFRASVKFSFGFMVDAYRKLGQLPKSSHSIQGLMKFYFLFVRNVSVGRPHLTDGCARSSKTSIWYQLRQVWYDFYSTGFVLDGLARPHARQATQT